MAYDILKEDVPRFRQRRGDMVLSGPNNSTIVLGRDRRGARDTGYGDRPGSGAILIVVGREGEDPSLPNDRASVYLSSRSDPDDVLETGQGGKETDVSSVVSRGDCVRVVARRDVKIVVGQAYFHMKADGSVVVEGDIRLGKNAAQRLIRESYHSSVFLTHTHLGGTLPGGVTGTPQPAPAPPAVFTDKSMG